MRRLLAPMLLMCAAAGWAQPTEAPPVQLALVDIRASGALNVLASLTRTPLVVASDFDAARLTLDDRFDDAPAALAGIARRLGAVSAQVGRITVLRAPCRGPAAPVLPDGLASQTVSVDFQHVALADFFSLLGSHGAAATAPGTFMSPETARFAIVARQLPIREMVEAVAVAHRLQHAFEGSVHRFERLPGAAGACPMADPKPRPVADAPSREPNDRSCPSPRRSSDGAGRPCSALELYSLDELSFKGTIHAGGAAVALVELPDGQVLALRRGDALGRQQGRVGDIGDSGFELLEQVPDERGGRVGRRLFVRYAREVR